jgi:hypothetical protein
MSISRLFARTVRVATVPAVTVLALAVTGILAAGPAGAALTSGPGGTWSPARQIVTPATRANSEGGIAAVSCPPGGACVAFGTYEVPGVPFGADTPFVTTRTRTGDWTAITPIPGTAALAPGEPPRAVAGGIACPSAGNCTVYGHYRTTSSAQESSFVATEKRGVWGPAQAVTAQPSMGATKPPYIQALACQSAGNCIAGGDYATSSHLNDTEAFVLAEVKGAWGSIEPLSNPSGVIISASCPLKGACVALGATEDTLFAATEAKGAWATAKTVRGTAPADVSCAPTGRCVVAATFGLRVGTYSEKSGVWGKVQLVPGSQEDSVIPGDISIACPSSATCSLAWNTVQSDEGRETQAFTDLQKSGSWGKATLVTGLGYAGALAIFINGLACGEPGNCAVAGEVFNLTTLIIQGFLISQSQGVWHKAFIVPGIVKLAGKPKAFGGSRAYSVACWSRFRCVAGGVYYRGTSLKPNSFVTTESY